MRLPVALMSLALLAASCTGVRSSVKSEYKNLTPRRSATEIEVHYEPPSKAHQIIGELSMNFKKTPREEVIEKMKAEAARLGADGMILEKVHTYRDEWLVSGQTPRSKSTIGARRYRLTAAIYRYLQEPR